MNHVFLRQIKMASTKNISYIIKLLPLERILETYFRALNRKGTAHISYQKRFFNNGKTQTSFPSLENLFIKDDIGIVLQGPILHHQDFTYLTILRYLQYYPGLQIVLATWKSENIKKFTELALIFPNLHILQLDKPSLSGWSNINYQITSTKAGLSKIKEMGLNYVIKSRTDQCLFDPFALDKLRLAYESYDNVNDISRICFLSLNSFLFRLYGPSDMFQFGKTDQIIKYWDVPNDAREPKDPGYKISLRTMSKHEFGEFYMCINYLRSLGFKLDFTMKQNLTFFRDLFIILDASHVDLIWNKYTYNNTRWVAPTFPHLAQEWNYALWSGLNYNLDYLANYDSFLESPMN